jgi:hypothetical protein
MKNPERAPISTRHKDDKISITIAQNNLMKYFNLYMYKIFDIIYKVNDEIHSPALVRVPENPEFADVPLSNVN